MWWKMMALACVLLVGCKGTWKSCNSSVSIYGAERIIILGRATYRVVDTDPLTVEYKGTTSSGSRTRGVIVADRVECY